MADVSRYHRLPLARLGLSVGRACAKQPSFQFFSWQPLGELVAYLQQGVKVDSRVNAEPVEQMNCVLGGDIA